MARQAAEPKQKRLSVDIDADVKERLDAQCERHSVRQNSVVNKAVRRIVESLEETEPVV